MLIICSLFESDAGVGIPTPILRLFLAVHGADVVGQSVPGGRTRTSERPLAELRAQPRYRE